MVEAVHLGALALVLKASEPETLLDCVRRVHGGERPIDGATTTRGATVGAARAAKA